MPRIMFCMCLMTGAISAQGAFAGLLEYVARADDSYAYTVESERPLGTNTTVSIRLTSQTWQGIPWSHWVTVLKPERVEHPDTALLLIGGGSNRSTPPELNSSTALVLAQVAQRTGSIVAAIEQVPNQPLFDGLAEDALIAYTFEKFLDGAGDDWPLLQPMVKSVVRGMDAIQSVARDAFGQEVSGFVLTGGSKRGWTTYLTGAADNRVAAIAPMVFDMLNMEEQLAHQQRAYGEYSDRIRDYTQRGIQKRLEEAAAGRLLDSVDPFEFAERLTMPKLILLGTNDPDWVVDAASLYFPELKEPKYLHYEANAGHGLGAESIAALTAFYERVLTSEPMPRLTWKETEGALEAAWNRPDAQARLWSATAPSRDFRQARWTSDAVDGNQRCAVPLAAPAEGWRAFYVDVVFPSDDGLPLTLSTTITVVPDTFPERGSATTQ